MNTPDNYYNLILFFEVINCNNIKIDLFKNNDVYMQAELLPYSLFDGQNKKTTRVMKKGENLVINETLEL